MRTLHIDEARRDFNFGMTMETKPKKLIIRRSTIGTLKMQTGVKTGGTCDNACGGTTDTCPEAATKCPLHVMM